MNTSSTLPMSFNIKSRRLKSIRAPGPVKKSPSAGNCCLYIARIASIAPSLICKDGECGKKSLPTKKQRNTKSSSKRSKSKANGNYMSLNSKYRYSLTTFSLINWNYTD